MRVTRGSFVLFALTIVAFATAVLAQNEITETGYGREPDYPSQGGAGGGWFNSARNALAGPAGQMVVHMAKEMISRSAGNSQVSHLPAFIQHPSIDMHVFLQVALNPTTIKLISCLFVKGRKLPTDLSSYSENLILFSLASYRFLA